MEYFRLIQNTKNPIKILGLDNDFCRGGITNDKFKQIDSTSIAYIEYQKEQEIPDVFTVPVVLVSSKLKKVLHMYQDNLEWKAIQVFPKNEDMISQASPLYWIGNFKIQNCVHRDSEFYPNGNIKKLILDKTKIKSQDIFYVGEILENYIIVSLPVAESILRRNLYGAGIERIMIK